MVDAGRLTHLVGAEESTRTLARAFGCCMFRNRGIAKKVAPWTLTAHP